MNIEVNITIENNDVTFHFREFSTKETVKGIILFNKERTSILNVGATEEEVKESILGTLPSNKDSSTFVESPEMHKMFNDLLNMSYEETVKLCMDDPINGPDMVWERLKDNIDFVYPFDLNNPDYTYMALFIQYNLILITEEKNKGKGIINAVRRTLFEKYSLNISFKEISSDQNQRNILKEELGKALKAQIKIKELIIGGDYI